MPDTYSKRYVAHLYFPHLTDKAARNRLSRTMRLCTPLMQRLTALGYTQSQRHFTIRQRDLVYEFLGEP